MVFVPGPRRTLRLFFGKEIIEAFFVDFGEFFKLHQIHPPLAGLDLGNVRLRFAQLVGDLLLFKPAALARFFELIDEMLVCGRVNGLFHINIAYFYRLWYIPNCHMPKWNMENDL